MKNILTGEVVTNIKVDKLICCMREGREAYTRFLNDRLKNKSLSIHSTISKIKFAATGYASHRGYTIDELLQHEITNSAFFLMDENGYLRKSIKSQLGTEMLKICPLINKKGQKTPHKPMLLLLISWPW